MVNWKKHQKPFCNVYIIAPDRKWPVKVGISNSVENRLAQLQTSHWKRLFVTNCFYCATVSEARRVEAKAHAMLKEDNKSLLGEWFDVHPKQASEIVQFAADIEGIELMRELPEGEIKDKIQKRVAALQGQSHLAFMTELYGEAQADEFS